MLENRIARYLAAESATKSITSTLTNRGKQPLPDSASAGNRPIRSQADLYRLAFEQAREEAQRKHWSNNRIRKYFE